MADVMMAQSEYVDTVTLPREYYDVLLNDAMVNGLIFNAIFDNAGLTWNEKGLKVSDDALNPILKAIYPDEYKLKLWELKREKYPDEYKQKLCELKREKEAKEGENGAD